MTGHARLGSARGEAREGWQGIVCAQGEGAVALGRPQGSRLGPPPLGPLGPPHARVGLPTTNSVMLQTQNAPPTIGSEDVDGTDGAPRRAERELTRRMNGALRSIESGAQVQTLDDVVAAIGASVAGSGHAYLNLQGAQQPQYDKDGSSREKSLT